MRKWPLKLALTVALMLAIIFTFSCSGDSGGGGGNGDQSNISSGMATGNSSSSSNGSEVAGPVKKDKISGFSQKGPFTKGSSITLSELNDKLAQTGRSFEEMITDDKGSFEIKNIELASPYVMLKANGYYRNEVSGAISKSPINLYAIADIREKSNVNVNILTHLEYYRVQKLVEGGKSLKEAKKQAQKEILAVFGITGQFKDSEDMSIFGTSDGDAALLAISVLLQGELTEGQFTERLSDFSIGFRETGKWDNNEAKKAMADWASGESGKGYCLYSPSMEYPGDSNCWPMPTDDMCQGGRLVNSCSNPNSVLTPEKVRSHILAWNFSSTVPDYEKFVSNYWKVYYDFGACDAKKAGEIKEGPGGKRYICKDNAWVVATKYEIELGLCTKEGEIKEGEITGVLNTKTKGYLICKDKAWEIATDYELDTYQWVCSKADEIKEGQSGTKYTCKNNVWIIVTKCFESKSCQTFTDARDKQQYYFVKIGEQTWMAQNLNYDTKTTGSVCYDNKPANCDIYGRLYDWKTAKEACPAGWHLPSMEEWEELFNFAIDEFAMDEYYYDGLMSLMVTGRYHSGSICDNNGCREIWYNSTDDYGFSALLGGVYSGYNNSFSNENRSAHLWAALNSDCEGCGGGMGRGFFSVNYGNFGDMYYSVRCLQD